MGNQWRFCLMFKRFLGVGILLDEFGDKALSIWIPFVRIYIGLTKGASGIYLFGKEFK